MYIVHKDGSKSIYGKSSEARRVPNLCTLSIDKLNAG